METVEGTETNGNLPLNSVHMETYSIRVVAFFRKLFKWVCDPTLYCPDAIQTSQK